MNIFAATVLRKCFCIFLICLSFTLNAQTQDDRPQLVITLVVDQMRADYLTRYWEYFGEGGFKRLAQGGANFKNTHYNFFPTYTAAGHSCISTGATPSVNGIVGNEWYNRKTKKIQYCTSDTSVKTIGSSSSAGLMSAASLLSTTLGDELRLATNFRSRVIGIALKDRAAILSSGHNVTGAYWFDESTGHFISSSYYCEQLPDWLDKFNAQNKPAQYLSQKWTLSLPENSYRKTSTPDDVPYEGAFKGESAPVFPHDIPSIRSNYNYGLLRSIPGGNTITFELARAAIEGEHLGKNDVPDLLTISFSTPDYIGHQFGPRSMEVADMYIKFDKELDAFLKYLDSRIGSGKYLIALSADHGAADNPSFLTEKKFPGGFVPNTLKDTLNDYFQKLLNIRPCLAFENQQVYLDHALLTTKKIPYPRAIAISKEYLEKLPYVNIVYDKDQILQANAGTQSLSFLKNGYLPGRCGDVVVVFHPNYFEAGPRKTGTTHGSIYSYDTRVPLIFFGWKIRPASTFERTNVIDIAPTLAAILDIQEPNGSQGKILTTIINTSGN